MARHISRRQVISYAAGAAAVVVLPGVIEACASSSSTGTASPGTASPATAVRSGDELPVVPSIVSTDGLLTATLTAKTSAVDVGAPQRLQTLTYDDSLPGRTWDIKPGTR